MSRLERLRHQPHAYALKPLPGGHFVKQKGPNPIDAEVGRRIKLQRMSAGLTQSELAQELGVTFQQLQKNEYGVNRVGASRLAQIAKALKVPVALFFEGTSKHYKINPSARSPTELLTQPYALRLLQAFSKLNNNKVRSLMVRTIEAISADQSSQKSQTSVGQTRVLYRRKRPKS